LGAESINRFHYFCQDPKPISDTRKKWTLDLYIQNKERVAHPRRTRKAKTRIRKAILPEPWENLDKIDLTQSERTEH